MKLSVNTSRLRKEFDNADLSEAIEWINKYQGDNSFLASCKRTAMNKYPFSADQLTGIKKCYAYHCALGYTFKLNETLSKIANKEMEIILSEQFKF